MLFCFVIRLLIDYYYDCDNRIFVVIVILLLFVVRAWSIVSLENFIFIKVWICKEKGIKLLMFNRFINIIDL